MDQLSLEAHARWCILCSLSLHSCRCLQNRYMKSAKDWGWREFITLQALFDADAGHLLNDDCVFAAEVLMLKESSEAHQVRLSHYVASIANSSLLNDGMSLWHSIKEMHLSLVRPKIHMS